MEKIKVDKKGLIKALEENKEKHLKDYAIAVEGYKIAVKKALSKKMKELKNLEDENLKGFDLNFYHLVIPESHEDDFDTAIGMLGVTTESEVYITAQEYKQYYKNEWSWARNWYLSNSGNIGIATTSPASKYYVDSIK